MDIVTTDELNELMKRMSMDMPYMKGLLMSDESKSPYGIELLRLASLMLYLHMAKDAGYGRSWSKHGEVGVYENLMRKDDRLEQLSLLIMSDHDMVERRHRVAFVDVLIDRALYCMMWVSYVAKVRPDDFMAWLEDSWCKSTGVSIEEVAEFVKE